MTPFKSGNRPSTAKTRVSSRMASAAIVVAGASMFFSSLQAQAPQNQLQAHVSDPTPAAAVPPAAGKPEQKDAPDTTDKRVKRTSGFYEPEPLSFNDHTGYTQIFNGVDLKGWDGDPETWHVEEGAIVGDSTVEHPLANSYISYRDIEAKDFDLKLEIRVEHGGGSGIQYRSHTDIPWRRPAPAGKSLPPLKWMMTGPQADFWFPVAPMTAEWTGQFYSENTPLGIIAWRGQVVESSAKTAPQLMGDIADREALGGYIKVNDWNQYTIIARGGTFIHLINGHLMAVYVDDDPNSSNNKSGLIGIEIEGVPSKVSVRNVWLKKLN